jgi:hypothetical protein
LGLGVTLRASKIAKRKPEQRRPHNFFCNHLQIVLTCWCEHDEGLLYPPLWSA